MKEKEHPLVVAIKLKQKAKRANAHPKIINRIQRRITEETKKTINIMRKSSFISSILDSE